MGLGIKDLVPVASYHQQEAGGRCPVHSSQCLGNPCAPSIHAGNPKVSHVSKHHCVSPLPVPSNPTLFCPLSITWETLLCPPFPGQPHKLSHAQITSVCLALPCGPGDPTSLLGFWSPPGIVHDGVEPVCNGQHRAGLKLGADGSLDEVVHLQVDGSCSLV